MNTVNRNTLVAIVAEIFEAEPNDIDGVTDLTKLPGFDSVNVLSLMIALDERAGIRMRPEDAASLRTFRQIEALATRQGVVIVDGEVSK